MIAPQRKHKFPIEFLASMPTQGFQKLYFFVVLRRFIYLFAPSLVCMLGCSVMCDSLRPHGLWHARFLCPWNFLGKNTGVGCHFLLQGIFPTQGSNWCLLASTCIGRFFTTWATWEIHIYMCVCVCVCVCVIVIKTIPKKKKGKMVVWWGLTNRWEKKRSERQRRKGKIQAFECRVPKSSKER